MKIIKVLSKKVDDKDYHKYIVTLPKEAVEKSELLGKQVKAEAERGKIVIEKDKD
jgi:hypothetical protein